MSHIVGFIHAHDTKIMLPSWLSVPVPVSEVVLDADMTQECFPRWAWVPHHANGPKEAAPHNAF